jgi:hypothetical protein
MTDEETYRLALAGGFGMKAPWPGTPGGYVPVLADRLVADAQRRARRVMPPKNERFSKGYVKPVKP